MQERKSKGCILRNTFESFRRERNTYTEPNITFRQIRKKLINENKDIHPNS